MIYIILCSIIQEEMGRGVISRFARRSALPTQQQPMFPTSMYPRSPLQQPVDYNDLCARASKIALHRALALKTKSERSSDGYSVLHETGETVLMTQIDDASQSELASPPNRMAPYLSPGLSEIPPLTPLVKRVNSFASFSSLPRSAVGNETNDSDDDDDADSNREQGVRLRTQSFFAKLRQFSRRQSDFSPLAQVETQSASGTSDIVAQSDLDALAQMLEGIDPFGPTDWEWVLRGMTMEAYEVRSLLHVCVCFYVDLARAFAHFLLHSTFCSGS
jgi:hypothetical protein